MSSESERECQAPSTSEEKTYTIKKPARDEEVVVTHSLQDCVEVQGYVRRSSVVVLECGCCGALSSFDTDLRYKPPAGRCQNPDCRALLCAKHVEECHYCCVCGTQLCPACMRQAKGEPGLVFCKKHFETHADQANSKWVQDCMTKE